MHIFRRWFLSTSGHHLHNIVHVVYLLLVEAIILFNILTCCWRTRVIDNDAYQFIGLEILFDHTLLFFSPGDMPKIQIAVVAADWYR